MYLLCLQVEEVVAGTNTGMSPALAGFYHYWEKRVFNALATMIIGSMAALHALLQPLAGQRPPLCEVCDQHMSVDVSACSNDMKQLLILLRSQCSCCQSLSTRDLGIFVMLML